MNNTQTTHHDLDAHEVELMAHPDGDFRITLERVNDNYGGIGILRVTDEEGVTVTVSLGGIGLLELGLDLARHGKELIE
jgi:hypothetical protein